MTAIDLDTIHNAIMRSFSTAGLLYDLTTGGLEQSPDRLIDGVIDRTEEYTKLDISEDAMEPFHDAALATSEPLVADIHDVSYHSAAIRYAIAMRSAVLWPGGTSASCLAENERWLRRSVAICDQGDPDTEKTKVCLKNELRRTKRPVQLPSPEFHTMISPQGEAATTDTHPNSLECADFKYDRNWLTAAYCKLRFGLDDGSLSRWARGECPHLDGRELRRLKVENVGFCYHRIDIDEIVKARERDD